MLAAIAMGLPDPWWAAITAWRVADAHPEATLTRGLQRVIGTVGGAAFGFLATGLVVGEPVLQALALFGTAYGCTWYRFASGRWSYGWTLAGITSILVMVQGLSDPNGLFAFAQARVEEILCGVVVASATVVLLGGEGAGHISAAPAAAPSTEGLARIALLGSFAMLGVVLLWDALDLPAVVQMAVGVLVVIDRDMIMLRRRGGQRLLGCLAGGLYGLTLIGLGLDGLLLWAVAVGGGVFLFSRPAIGGGAYAYFGIQGGMAVLTTLIVGDGPPATFVPVIERFTGNAIGVALIVVLSFVLAPPPPPRRR